MADSRALRSRRTMEESPSKSPQSAGGYALRRDTAKPLRYREQDARTPTTSPSPKKSPARSRPTVASPQRFNPKMKVKSPLKSPPKKKAAAFKSDAFDRIEDDFIDPGSMDDRNPANVHLRTDRKPMFDSQNRSRGVPVPITGFSSNQNARRVMSGLPSVVDQAPETHVDNFQQISLPPKNSATTIGGNAVYGSLVPKATDLPAMLKENLRRLKNVLKLPKARRWAYCEFFYSNTDRELFLGDNEFSQCLRESFPNLRCRNLSKVEWRHVRRLIGKPRRCSQAFFDEERMALAEKRQTVRDIYTGIQTEVTPELSNIPVKIPRPLIVGTKIHARVRQPKDGIYAGTVDAVLDDSYRIIFDKEELVPPLIIKDYEVMSTDSAKVDLASVNYFLERNKASLPTPLKSIGSSHQGAYMSPSKILSSDRSPLLRHDPLLTASSIARSAAGISPRRNVNASLFGRDEKVGNFPVRMLVMLVKLSKLIEMKRSRVKQIAEMNSSLERLNMLTDRYPFDLQERYAQAVVELEQINKQMSQYMQGVSEYARVGLAPQLTGEPTVASRPEALRKLCRTHAVQIVKHCNNGLNVESRPALELATSLTALLLQVRALGQQRCSAFELGALSESLKQLRIQVAPNNAAAFQDNVEVHMKHIHQMMLQSAAI